MTYEERQKWLCEQCRHHNDCAYRIRGLDATCVYAGQIMDGWELGQQDTADKAEEWVRGFLKYSSLFEYQVPDWQIEKTISDMRKFIMQQSD